MMRGAERFARVDQDGVRAARDAAAVVAAVNRKAPGDHRRQGRLGHRDPVQVGHAPAVKAGSGTLMKRRQFMRRDRGLRALR